MKVFDYDDYRAFIRARVASMPHKGHGQYRKMALSLNIQTSMLSQIMSGHREMSLEMASLLCDYFGFKGLESDYFLLLVQLKRAGNLSLKKNIQRQLDELKKKGKELDHRLPKDTALSEATKAIFYSYWYYSGVRLSSSIDGLNSVDAIAEYLQLPIALVARVVAFLVSCGLCIEKNGKIRVGPQRTHLSSDSPMIARHHVNWRNKAMERFDQLGSEELVFTSPVVVSKADGVKVRQMLLQFIDEWKKVVDPSPCESLHCLNIDWVNFSKR